MNKTDILNEVTRIINYAVESEQWQKEHNQPGECTTFEVIVNFLSMLHLKIYSEFERDDKKCD